MLAPFDLEKREPCFTRSRAFFRHAIMSEWSRGYVTDIAYNLGYYPEFNPLRVALTLMESGWAAPSVTTACELGFGQGGFSANIHAAASDVQWHGTTIHPTQANCAGNLADGASAGSDTNGYPGQAKNDHQRALRAIQGLNAALCEKAHGGESSPVRLREVGFRLRA